MQTRTLALYRAADAAQAIARHAPAPLRDCAERCAAVVLRHAMRLHCADSVRWARAWRTVARNVARAYCADASALRTMAR